MDTSGSSPNWWRSVVKLDSLGVDSPPCGVGNREPSNKDDRADNVVAGTEGVSIKNLESFCSRIRLKSTEMLMHVVPVGESSLQRESNRLCRQEARRHVNKHSIEDIFSSVYI